VSLHPQVEKARFEVIAEDPLQRSYSPNLSGDWGVFTSQHQG